MSDTYVEGCGSRKNRNKRKIEKIDRHLKNVQKEKGKKHIC
jgi:hypothetical protein